ncbi:MAG: glycosyltransferase family 39 protein [Ktedonobacteraceae bacterium]|nr:glycosyltransferase family 39 protein [Ktedonobacteraceae bacterium]
MRFFSSSRGAANQPRGPALLNSPSPPKERENHMLQVWWKKWAEALKAILPIYIAQHLAVFIITILLILFQVNDFDASNARIKTLWEMWHHWDTGHYIHIATYGYTESWRTAFFPLYPLLIKGLSPLVTSPLIAGLLISNIAGLIMCTVLYQLVREDFEHEMARRTVLFLSLFPTAFFFLAAYNESLFLCLVLLCFYHIRRGHWWLAGLFGMGASLTRSAGVFLLLPFCYEYLRQHEFRWTTLRPQLTNAISMALIPLGVGIFAFYCYARFDDALAFSHAQSHWGRYFTVPWWGAMKSFFAIKHSSGLLSFQALHNLLDLVPTLLILTLILLGLFGPWRFPRSYLSYSLYAITLFLFLQSVPINWIAFPLQSQGRYMLEIFPAFIVLARLGEYEPLQLTYRMVSGATLFVLLTLFLLGHWVV